MRQTGLISRPYFYQWHSIFYNSSTYNSFGFSESSYLIIEIKLYYCINTIGGLAYGLEAFNPPVRHHTLAKNIHEIKN